MDYVSINDIVSLRLLERLIAVVIGGTAIYFGYKLFLMLPSQSDSSGKIQIPGVSVILTKVGPGVFFAAFGAIIVYQSLISPLKVETPHVKVSGALEEVRKVESTIDTGHEAQKISKIRETIQMLNCLETIAVKKTGLLRSDDVEEPIREAKIALLEKIWNPTKWGNKEDFKSWTILGIGKVPDELRRLYEAELPGCPQ